MLINRISPLWSFYFAPDDDGGGNGDEDAATRERGFQKRLKDYNDNATDLALSLWEDNFKYRRRNQDLTNQLKEATGKVPAAGSVVLTPEEAQQLTAYKALGTPEQVKTIVDERDQLQGKLGTLERETTLQRAAMVAGYDYDVLKEVDTLATQVGGKKLSYLVKETEEEGNKVQRAFVKEGETETPLADYAQSNWAKHLPSLVVQRDDSQGGNQSSQGSGHHYPPQHQGTGNNTNTQAKTPKAQTEAVLNNNYPKKVRQP